MGCEILSLGAAEWTQEIRLQSTGERKEILRGDRVSVAQTLMTHRLEAALRHPRRRSLFVTGDVHDVMMLGI